MTPDEARVGCCERWPQLCGYHEGYTHAWEEAEARIKELQEELSQGRKHLELSMPGNAHAWMAAEELRQAERALAVADDALTLSDNACQDAPEPHLRCMECVACLREAALMTIRDALSASTTEEDGEHCDDCGRAYDDVYTLPDEVWARIHERAPAGLLCPQCAIRRMYPEAQPTTEED